MSAWALIPNADQSVIQNMAGTGAVNGGGLSGAQGDSVLLQYVGNNTFMVTAFVGHVTQISSNVFARNGVVWTPPDYSKTYTWTDGNAFCAGLTTGNLTGWRMPQVAELISIDTFGVKGTHGWPSTPANIWATDPSPSTPGAYAVEAFGFAVSGFQFGTNNLVITCVRS